MVSLIAKSESNYPMLQLLLLKTDEHLSIDGSNKDSSNSDSSSYVDSCATASEQEKAAYDGKSKAQRKLWRKRNKISDTFVERKH